MEITKWLPGSICAALLAVSGVTSLQLARGAAQREALQSRAIVISEKPLCSVPAPSAPASADIDATVKRYYFEHLSEFAPLPASPSARAAAFRQLESQIRQKLGI